MHPPRDRAPRARVLYSSSAERSRFPYKKREQKSTSVSSQPTPK